MKKMIISLTVGNTVYHLGQEAPDVSGREVVAIAFKRDGVYNITKGAKEESHYAITLANQLSDKDVVTMIVPFGKVDRFLVADVEEENDKKNDSTEVADELAQVD